MLKNKTKIITLFLILILLFSTNFVFAENETADNGIMPISENSTEIVNPNARVEENNYKKSDVYLTGNSVTIDYIVDGNLFVCANTVTINSQIGGDAFILAKNLIIDGEGYVFSNLFAIADSIDIKGVVYDIFSLSKTLTISQGYVYRDLKASCNTININGVIGRNAFVNCANLNFNSDGNTNGVIHGNLNYSASSEFSIPENVVNGTVNYNPLVVSEKSIQTIIADYILDLGAFIVFVLVVWLICLWLAPKFLDNTNSYVGKKSLGILGYGLLTLIAVPICCVILLLLQLTANVSIFLFGVYILSLAIASTLFTITTNNYICSKLKINKNLGILGMLILSSIVVWLLTQIPYVGTILSIAIIVLGLGILVYSILPKKATKKINDNKKSEN